jgi:hypothetical protein
MVPAHSTRISSRPAPPHGDDQLRAVVRGVWRLAGLRRAVLQTRLALRLTHGSVSPTPPTFVRPAKCWIRRGPCYRAEPQPGGRHDSVAKHVHLCSGNGVGPRDCRRDCHYPGASEEAGPEMTSLAGIKRLDASTVVSGARRRRQPAGLSAVSVSVVLAGRPGGRGLKSWKLCRPAPSVR